jgi:hypothetical protein
MIGVFMDDVIRMKVDIPVLSLRRRFMVDLNLMPWRTQGGRNDLVERLGNVPMGYPFLAPKRRRSSRGIEIPYILINVTAQKVAKEHARNIGAFLDQIVDLDGSVLPAELTTDIETGKSESSMTISHTSTHDRNPEKTKRTTHFTALGRSIRVPEDFFLEPGDSLYLRYFIEEFGEVFSFGILSGTRPLWQIFSRAMEHTPLRHTVIAVAAWLYDGMTGRARDRSFANLRKAIPLIQTAVTSTALDDGHGFAVFLLSFLSVIRGDIKGIRSHIGGYYQILRHCNVLKADGTPNMAQSAVSMIMWRMAVRTENMIGFVAGQDAAFPAASTPDSFHSTWLHEFDNPLRLECTNWAIAQFALDDLANRTIHLAVRLVACQRAIANREHDGIEQLNVELDTAFLIRDLEQWKSRPVLREAESRERIRRETSPTQPPFKFLHHGPLTISDETYAILLVQYFTVRIQLSLVVNPQIGPYPSERYVYAIELCRVYAAIGGLKRPGLSGLIIGLFYAGLTLTDKTHPLGTLSPSRH